MEYDDGAAGRAEAPDDGLEPDDDEPEEPDEPEPEPGLDPELGAEEPGAPGGRGAPEAGRNGADADCCGRKLSVERGGEFAGAGGAALVTGGLAAGRAGGAGAGEADGVEAEDGDGAAMPGLFVGLPVPPPLASARAAALSAAPTRGRVVSWLGELGELGDGWAGAGRAGADGELADDAGLAAPDDPALDDPVDDGRDGIDDGPGDGGAGRALPGAGPAPDGGDDAGAGFTVGAGAAAVVVTGGRDGAVRTRVVGSSPDAPGPSSGSDDFRSVASAVIGLAPPPLIC